MSAGDTDIDGNSFLLSAGATTRITRTTIARTTGTGRRLARRLWVIGFTGLVLRYLALFFLDDLSAVSLNGNGITTSSQHDHHRGRPRRQCFSPEYHSNVLQKQHPMSCPTAVSVGKSHAAGLSASPVYCGLCAATTTTVASSPSNNEQFMAHFQELVDQIKVYAHENQCQDQLTIYGNAFGTTYGEGHFFRYIWDRYKPAAQIQYSPCIFYFVLERTLQQIATRFPNGSNILWHNSAQQGKNQTSSSSFVGLFAGPLLWEYTGGKSLVGVRQSILPYKSLRRNGKLIKMNPHLLFPWASRVLYMDSKLERRWRIGHRQTTIDLDQFFFGQHNTNTTRSTKAPRNDNYVSDDHDDDSMSCASMILMPPWHKHTMVAATEKVPGRQQPRQSLLPLQLQLHQQPALSSFSFEPRDRFEAHCRAIQQSSRSDVSDSLMAVIRQCEAYTSQVRQDFLFQQTISGRRESLSSSSVAVVSPLDAPLIDGAMIAWNLRTLQCRQFVADLTCTWLDEIHCYSDRDQVSWPYTLYQMQLVPFAVHHTHHHQVTTSSNGTTYGTDTNHQGPILLEADEWDDRRDLYYGRLPAMTAKLKQQQHDDPNSTRLQVLSSLPRPLLHLHTSYCHWYFDNSKRRGDKVLRLSACQRGGAVRI